MLLVTMLNWMSSGLPLVKSLMPLAVPMVNRASGIRSDARDAGDEFEGGQVHHTKRILLVFSGQHSETVNAVGGEFAHSLGEVLHALTGRFKFQIVAIVEVIFQFGMVAPRDRNAVTKGVVHAARKVDDEAKEVGREGFHLSARSDIGFVDAALAVHEADAVDAQLGVKRHSDAERTAPFVEVHRGQVKRYVGFHAAERSC